MREVKPDPIRHLDMREVRPDPIRQYEICGKLSLTPFDIFAICDIVRAPPVSEVRNVSDLPR